jgi:hypothetical protein
MEHQELVRQVAVMVEAHLSVRQELAQLLTLALVEVELREVLAQAGLVALV